MSTKRAFYKFEEDDLDTETRLDALEEKVERLEKRIESMGRSIVTATAQAAFKPAANDDVLRDAVGETSGEVGVEMAARLLGVTERQVRRWCDAGAGRKVNGSWRVDLDKARGMKR